MFQVERSSEQEMDANGHAHEIQPVTTECLQCEQPFEYTPKRSGRGNNRRVVCPGCVRVNQQHGMATARSRLRRIEGEEPGDSLTGLYGVSQRSQADAAEILGVEPQTVQQSERNALYKIRNDPQLRALRAEQVGCKSVSIPITRAERELTYGEQVAAWQALAGQLHRDGFTAEAAEIMGLLEAFCTVWRRELERATCLFKREDLWQQELM